MQPIMSANDPKRTWQGPSNSDQMRTPCPHNQKSDMRSSLMLRFASALALALLSGLAIERVVAAETPSIMRE